MKNVRVLDRLEKKFGHLAIRGLMLYIVALNLAVFLLALVDPSGNLTGKLALVPSQVFKGEVWRLITYIFIPPSASVLWILFTLYFYYLIGTSLEHEWGSFRFNVYYFVGMIGTTCAAFITGGQATAVYLNLSLFLAFASLYPNYEILLFFLVPVKMKYLAWLNWLFIAYTVVFQPIPMKIAAIVSIINYFVFFGTELWDNLKARRQVHYNRKRFFKEIREGTKKYK